MSPIFVFNPNKQLRNIKNGRDVIMYTLKKLADNPPKDVSLIGIATNVMLGVFKLDRVPEGYICRRICVENDKIEVSDIGYPVSNMDTPYTIDCEMDYIVGLNMIKNIKF